jgi:hypothetical protein
MLRSSEQDRLELLPAREATHTPITINFPQGHLPAVPINFTREHLPAVPIGQTFQATLDLKHVR